MTTNDADLYTRLGRIEAKLDMALPALSDQAKRLNNLEIRVASIAGGVSLVVAVASRLFL